MKKYLAIIMACVVFIASLTWVDVSAEEIGAQNGFTIVFNGEVTDYESVVINNTHYVPMRKVFEKMGAYVFYSSRYNQILTLTRDGDMIRHNVGDNTIVVNGEEKTFEKPSVIENDETYVPVDMVAAAFNPDGIFYDNQQLIIQKCMLSNEYHKIIKDVLDVCKGGAFYPERFERYISYHVKNPGYSIAEVLFRVNLGLDYSFYNNVATVEQPSELSVLVNKYFKLPEEFEQSNLVNMSREHTVNDGKQYYLSDVAYEKYIEMSDAAKKDGLSIKVISAYRTETYQRNLYNNKVRTTGKINADNYSARPGHSEHQTGLAVDVCSTRGAFEYTPEFKWMQEHAYEYGYILRYPRGKEWITGYSYEPWHYRYVGTDAAKRIYEEGITYEEYYAKYVSVNEFR